MHSVLVSFSVASQQVEEVEEVEQVGMKDVEEEEGRNNSALITFMAPPTL